MVNLHGGMTTFNRVSPLNYFFFHPQDFNPIDMRICTGIMKTICEFTPRKGLMKKQGEKIQNKQVKSLSKYTLY